MSIGRIKIIAGDFEHSNASQYLRGSLLMKNHGKFSREKISIREIAVLEEITQENVTSFSGAAGLGLAGGVLLGPVGMLAGLVVGGKRNNKTFRCTFNDGRAFIGTASEKTYNAISHIRMVAEMDPTDSNRQKNLKKTNKWLHIPLTIITLGLWGFIWLVLIGSNYAHNSKHKY